FRIGHMGAVDELMLLGAINTAEMVLLDLGVDLTPGSGAAAAGTVYRNK
ncbi:MAG: serine--glyoxylate aminotransferase, partial [Alphaproteobacteria bacterium]|nr:serine--glyoxylate aminotransferase [Alphaproteobacteria bacterium]